MVWTQFEIQHAKAKSPFSNSLFERDYRVDDPTTRYEKGQPAPRTPRLLNAIGRSKVLRSDSTTLLAI